MKIKQIIIKDTTAFLFTDNTEQDFLTLKEAYKNRDEVEFEFPLGYEEPILTNYNFLGVEYPCISLWFDNEDVPDFFNDFKNQL